MHKETCMLLYHILPYAFISLTFFSSAKILLVLISYYYYHVCDSYIVPCLLNPYCIPYIGISSYAYTIPTEYLKLSHCTLHWLQSANDILDLWGMQTQCKVMIWFSHPGLPAGPDSDSKVILTQLSKMRVAGRPNYGLISDHASSDFHKGAQTLDSNSTWHFST